MKDIKVLQEYADVLNQFVAVCDKTHYPWPPQGHPIIARIGEAFNAALNEGFDKEITDIQRDIWFEFNGGPW